MTRHESRVKVRDATTVEVRQSPFNLAGRELVSVPGNRSGGRHWSSRVNIADHRQDKVAHRWRDLSNKGLDVRVVSPRRCRRISVGVVKSDRNSSGGIGTLLIYNSRLSADRDLPANGCLAVGSEKRRS